MSLLGLSRALAASGLVLLVASQTSCGSSANGGLPGEVGTYEPDGGFFVGSGDASGRGALDAHIEQNHVTVTFVTLSCAGECAMVQAVGTGGYPPYTFEWDDGSIDAVRQVCPTASTSYNVKVTDTGTSGELARAPETVQVPLAAEVLSCPDGGLSGAGGGVCISNPSFEGTPAADAVSAPPWVACGNQATITNPSAGGSEVLQPTDGNTALFLRAQAGAPPPGAVSEPLCATVHAGTRYALTLDIASTPESLLAVPAEGLQIWGGSGSCSEGELLWSSPLAGPSWETYCATLAPTQDATYLTLVAYQAPDAGVAIGLGNVQVDHITPLPACP